MLIERDGVLGVEFNGRFIPAIAGGIGGSPSMPAPQVAPAPPREEDPEVQRRKGIRQAQARYAKGFASTIATDRSTLGGTQAGGQAPAQVTKLG